jgi:alpha-aminoadipic semialdehyde synthase
VSDISCDVNGSIEFLDRTTSIDNPFFEYDPSQKREVKANGNGITVCGVDILPTEMPRESSSHFGDALCPILEDYAGMNADEIPPVLENACIASGGELTPGYRYIQTLIGHSHHKKVKKSDLSMTLWLEGHLFDSGLINQVLDIIESHECGFEIKECRFRQTNGSTRKSKLVLGVSGETASALMSIETKIRILIKVIHKAQATMTRYNDNGVHGEPSSTSALTVESPVEQKVLIFGSGLVSESLVEYLGRRGNRQILVVSDDEDRARIVAQKARRGSRIGLNMTTVGDFELSELVKDADIVVSVLPAKMHPHVARACIGQRTDLVTASYESEEMRGLDIAARQAGISLVNEVGLDPGLDHMSAMKIIDDIHERGGTVTVFESLCGGLPAPEASDNPLRYKFSWSPMGVLSACQNAACYRRDGQIINVSGEDLLDSAETFLDVWSELELEALPNRNSLPYAGIYGIESARTVFRGTLRFGGFSSLMYTFRKMGLFDPSNAAASTWKEVISAMELPAEAIRARECLEWLGMLDSTPLACPESVMQSFCSVLEDKLKLQRHERDMVLMHHLIKASFEDGCSEVHRSSLQVFGDDKMTAMSKTVGYTVAATTELVLDGLLTKKGLILPTTPEIYNPILAALAKEGVTFNEFVEKT